MSLSPDMKQAARADRKFGVIQQFLNNSMFLLFGNSIIFSAYFTPQFSSRSLPITLSFIRSFSCLQNQ